MEQRIYNCTEEVKQTLIGIEEIHCNVIITKGYGNIFDLKQEAEQEAKERTKDEIEKYISTEEKHDQGQKIIHARLSLPFVYDKIMKDKENEIKMLHNELFNSYSEIKRLDAEVERLKLPWYKKLWKYISNNLQR